MAKTINVEIEGIRSLLQHRMVQNPEVDKLTKIVQKDSANEEAHKQLAEISTYRDKQGQLCIPSKYLETAFAKAGTNFILKGKKTYKDVMKGQVLVDPTMIPIDPQAYIINYEYVRIQMSRILRARPEIPEGWKSKFTLKLLDDSLPNDKIREVVEYSGSYVGIGDWRPKFGLFKVNSFEEV